VDLAPIVRRCVEPYVPDAFLVVKSEFEASISDRFVIDWFAQDDEREGENVWPGDWKSSLRAARFGDGRDEESPYAQSGAGTARALSANGRLNSDTLLALV
jgi:hypothetical protein